MVKIDIDSGKINFINHYETLEQKEKYILLDKKANKILKEVLMRGTWENKKNRIKEALIEAFDTTIAVKNIRDDNNEFSL